MYENDTYIGMVIEIGIQLAITFQLFSLQNEILNPKRNPKSMGMEHEKRFKKI